MRWLPLQQFRRKAIAIQCPANRSTSSYRPRREREGVSPKLVRALVKRESAGKPCAVSPKGAQGLMQLMPATQSDLGISDPFDAEANVNGGVRYLKQMLDRYEGNTALALAAYNAGPQRVTPGPGSKLPDIPGDTSLRCRDSGGFE